MKKLGNGWFNIVFLVILPISMVLFIALLLYGIIIYMVIPSQIKTKYIPSGRSTIAETLHIRVGSDLNLEAGDTIVIHSKKANKIEIERKKSTVPPGFNPHYASQN